MKNILKKEGGGESGRRLLEKTDTGNREEPALGAQELGEPVSQQVYQWSMCVFYE